MVKLIRGGEVYSPVSLGKQDILIAGGRILAIAETLAPSGVGEVTEIDARGKKVVPGFVDGHIHIIGAGGGKGPDSRSTLLHLGTLLKAGVTTVVGILGIDKVGFRLEDLLMRCRALELEGITAKFYLGSYTLPPATITGSVVSDLCLIEQAIGTKIALFERLSSHPTREQLAQVIADTYLGGRIGGKAGVVVAHLGDAAGDLSAVANLLDEMDIPQEKFVATHVNRSPRRLEEAAACGKRGMTIDLTGNIPLDTMIPASRAYRMLLEAGVPEEVITFSSDSNALHFAPDGTPSILPVDVCLRELRAMVRAEGLSLSQALAPLTKVPAAKYHLPEKGVLAAGRDADLLLLDEDLAVDTVIARGEVLLRDKRPLARGPMEESLLQTLTP